MQTTLYPQMHSLKTKGWEEALAKNAGKPIPAVTAHPGDWQYLGISHAARIPWLAILFSAGLHAVGLLAFNKPVPKAKPIVVEETEIIQMEMPPIKDEEEPPPTELEDQQDQAPAIAVPTLADVPTHVEVSDAFVQPLQLNVPVQADLGGAKLSTIPVKMATGPRSASGLKNIFDISQLDRVPEPIAQPSPRFPFELKSQVSQAEVVVEFIVDTDGYVQGANVIRSTHRGFDQASIDGVTKWRFKAGMKGGRKVNTRMMVPLRFNVVDSE